MNEPGKATELEYAAADLVRECVEFIREYRQKIYPRTHSVPVTGVVYENRVKNIDNLTKKVQGLLPKDAKCAAGLKD